MLSDCYDCYTQRITPIKRLLAMMTVMIVNLPCCRAKALSPSTDLVMANLRYPAKKHNAFVECLVPMSTFSIHSMYMYVLYPVAFTSDCNGKRVLGLTMMAVVLKVAQRSCHSQVEATSIIVSKSSKSRIHMFNKNKNMMLIRK